MTSSPSEEEIKNIIIKRLEAIKNKDENSIRTLMDPGYSKFDDWAPYQRQEGDKALENEFGAFKVLSSYNYEVKDTKIDALGDSAMATFIINYQAVLRNVPYNVRSRVTTVFTKRSLQWKIIHEHYSRFPDETQRQQFMPRRSMQP